MTRQTTLPVTLLTGFLGSGKTTLVNRILSAAHGRKIAVIVNEFGELGIDAALIAGATGSVIELANGCICCATQGDLKRALREMTAYGEHLDALMIETSGLADPAPVIIELLSPEFSAFYRLDGVVTLVDAENFDRNLENAEAAYQQIICGDLLIINRIDLVGSEIPALIEKGLRVINPRAPIFMTSHSRVPLDIVFGAQRLRIEAVRASQETSSRQETQPVQEAQPVDEPGAAQPPEGARHHGSFETLSLRFDKPLDPERFGSWFESLPAGVFRAKGFVRFDGLAEPLVVHAVGPRCSIEPAPPGVETEGAALVIIGLDLSADDLAGGLARCAA